MAEDLQENHSSGKLEPWFQNHGLFSGHFLQSRLSQWEEWQVGEELSTFRQGLLSLYEQKKIKLPTLNEAQTEDEFIKPVLDLLGYANSYMVQPHAKTGKQAIRPDYFLFPDEASKDEAYLKPKKKEKYYTRCIGIADAKYWERDLDLSKSNWRDIFSNLNPSFQIINYLIGAQQDWGILTNGRLWRLYSLKSHDHLGDYYQVDMVQLLKAPEEKLKYFYLFFRKAALLSQPDNKSFLDRVLEGSNAYAVELEADIKERAYEVVELLCRGFATGFPPAQLTPQVLSDIYDGSLILLYRLLFVFYAEARELLPLTTSADYRNMCSLRRLTDDIAEKDKKGYEPSDKLTECYHYLRNLFQLIDSGDHSKGIPEYNGGLFEPQEHQFLEKQTIADTFLVKAICHLTWVTDKKLGRVVAVDYNTLTERHLGSIYEGLLEFRPRIAPQDLVIIKDKNSIRYAHAKDYPGKDVKYHKGELYLANDKGERRASGSYYTPEYIVNYIVDNTLDPLAKQAAGKVKALKPEIDKEIVRLQEMIKDEPGLELVEKYDLAITKERERLLEPYLSLKVLDPAMGSGHFLARATDFLAEAIATDPSIELPKENTEETELTYYRRRIVESCIYGVDLNPLAVELAKLTLWLSTMAKTKPLSFLNHHLKVGNSLIGARVDNLDEISKKKRKKGKSIDLSRAPIQIGQFQYALNNHLKVLLERRALITQIPSETLENIHDKEKWEQDFEHHVERFRTLADLWVSTYFGNNVSWDGYNSLMQSVRLPDPEWENLVQKKSAQKALAMRKERHFFHWELEFPEVFYDEQGSRKASAGFDAIVGNPPYDVIAEKEQGIEVEPDKAFYSGREYLKPALGGKLNYYRLFGALSIWLCRLDGVHGFIVPMALIGDAQAESLRRYILTNTQLLYIEAFPQKDDPRDRVFGDAKLSTCIYILHKQRPSKPFVLRIHPGKFVLNTSPKVSVAKEDIELLDPEGLSIPSIPGTNAEHIKLGIALAKRSTGHCFGEIAPSQQGEVNLTTHSALLSSSPIGAQVLRGANVDRYRFNDEPKQGEPVYLNVDEFLRDKKRESKPFDYKELRIGYQRGSAIDNWRRIIACVIEQGNFCSDTVNYIVRPKADFYFVLGILNSRLYEWRFRLTSTNNHINSYEIDSLPLRPIYFTTSIRVRKELVEQCKQLYQEYLRSHKWGKLFAFIAQRLPQKSGDIPDTEHEQSDVVHDLLAFLAEEMTRLHKEKQSKIKGFLAWLEKEILKGSVEDQKNKTKIHNFHKGTFEELLDILKKNKTISDPYPPDKRDMLAHVFSDALNTIAPLKTDIEATDALIDQIVYKLYGLTDDETAIVEGQQSHSE